MEIHSSPGVEEPSPSQSAGDKNLRPVTASGSGNLGKQLSTCSPWKRPHGNGCWRRWMPFSEPSSPSEQSLSTRASIGKCGSVRPKSFMVAQCWECRWSHGSPGFLRLITPNSLTCCISLCSHHLLPFPWPPPWTSSMPYCMWDLCSACQRREFLSSQPVPGFRPSSLYSTRWTWQSPEHFWVISRRLGIRLGPCPRGRVELNCVSAILKKEPETQSSEQSWSKPNWLAWCQRRIEPNCVDM